MEMIDDDWSSVEVEQIDMDKKEVTLSNKFKFNHKTWYELFVNFWDNRIVGKPIAPIFYEYLFAKGGSNAHEQLMKGMKHEGFLLGSMDKPILSKRALEVGAIATIAIILLIVVVVLNQQGMIPGFGG